jgi:hypothetical protein
MTSPRTVVILLLAWVAALALCAAARGADAPPAQIITVGADGTTTTFVPWAATRPVVVAPPPASVPVVVPPIAPPPNPPPPVVPAADYTLRAGLPYHADARGQVATWDFGDPAPAGQPARPYNQQTGYNAAYVYSVPGLYRVTCVTEAYDVSHKTVRVTPDTRPVVPWRPGQPIRPNTIHDLGGVPVNVTAEVRQDAADSTLRNGAIVWSSTDPPPHGQIVWVRASNCTIENVRLGSNRAKPKGPTGGAKVGVGGVQIGIADGPALTACTVLRNVTGDDLDTFALVRDQARSTMLLDCATGDSLRGYGVFAEGCRWTVVAGLTCPGSRNEHCVRVESPRAANLCQYFAVVGGDLTQTAPPNPADKHGGCVEYRWGQYLSVYGTTARGGQVRAGPFGSTQSLDPVRDAVRRADDVLIQDVACRDGAWVNVRAGAGRVAVVRSAPVWVERADPRFAGYPTHDVTITGVPLTSVKKIGGDAAGLVLKP